MVYITIHMDKSLKEIYVKKVLTQGLTLSKLNKESVLDRHQNVY